MYPVQSVTYLSAGHRRQFLVLALGENIARLATNGGAPISPLEGEMQFLNQEICRTERGATVVKQIRCAIQLIPPPKLRHSGQAQRRSGTHAVDDGAQIGCKTWFQFLSPTSLEDEVARRSRDGEGVIVRRYATFRIRNIGNLVAILGCFFPHQNCFITVHGMGSGSALRLSGMTKLWGGLG
jgi:hypothetical protein